MNLFILAKTSSYCEQSLISNTIVAEINLSQRRVYCQRISETFGSIVPDLVVEDVQLFQTLVLLQRLSDCHPP
jgi:hypothetical protein